MNGHRIVAFISSILDIMVSTIDLSRSPCIWVFPLLHPINSIQFVKETLLSITTTSNQIRRATAPNNQKRQKRLLRNGSAEVLRLVKRYRISSTRARHRTGSRDEMRWSPNIKSQWTARIPVDHAWGTITEADKTKRNERDECGEMVEWNLW